MLRSVRRTRLEAGGPKVAIDLNNIALLLKETNRSREAMPLIRRALTIDEKSYGPIHPKVANRLNALAMLLKDDSCETEVEALLCRSLTIFEATLGAEHPNTQTVADNYRNLLRAHGAGEEEAEAKVAVAMQGE